MKHNFLQVILVEKRGQTFRSQAESPSGKRIPGAVFLSGTGADAGVRRH